MNINKLFSRQREEGQGLVEYALILVLVAIVVIAVLLLLGPAINQAFCKVANTLKPGTCGIIQSFSASKTGGMSPTVTVTVAVSQAASVKVTLQNGSSQTQSCTPSSCPSFSFTSVSPANGSYTVDADDGSSVTGTY